jgi:hypothetical protein
MEFMRENLAASGLTPEDMGATPCTYAPGETRNVSVKGAKGLHTFQLGYYIRAAYQFPYWDLDGSRLTTPFGTDLMWRCRWDLRTETPKEFVRKYDQPSRRAAGFHASVPYLHPARLEYMGRTATYDIHEGEKKARAAIKYAKQLCAAIGGANNWHDPEEEKGSPRVHRWLLEDIQSAYAAAVASGLIKDQRSEFTIRCWPDGDLAKYSVQTGWGGLGRLLADVGYNVIVMDLAPRFGTAAKFDDLLVANGGDGEAILAGAVPMSADKLAQTNEELLARIPGLRTLEVGSGENVVRRPAANRANFRCILRQHPAFRGQLWYNEDAMEFMLGDEPWVEDVTTSDVHDFFCNQLGFYRRGFEAAQSDTDATMVQVASGDRRSPFKLWLEGLKWDGQERLATMFPRLLHTPDTGFMREASKRMLIASVARIYIPGCDLRWMPVLQGAQNIGKSGFAKALWGVNNVAVLSPAAKDKDLTMLVHSALAVVDDEFNTLSRAEISHRKSFISMDHDSFRPPYARSTVRQGRRCVLLATTNDDAPLPHDPSGNNRYVVVPVGGMINFLQIQLEREQLWAEAVHLYWEGHKYSDVPNADEEARKWEHDTGPREAVIYHLASSGVVMDVGKGQYAVTGMRLFIAMGIEHKMQVQRDAGKVLRTLGFEQARMTGHPGWLWMIPREKLMEELGCEPTLAPDGGRKYN